MLVMTGLLTTRPGFAGTTHGESTEYFPHDISLPFLARYSAVVHPIWPFCGVGLRNSDGKQASMNQDCNYSTTSGAGTLNRDLLEATRRCAAAVGECGRVLNKRMDGSHERCSIV